MNSRSIAFVKTWTVVIVVCVVSSPTTLLAGDNGLDSSDVSYPTHISTPVSRLEIPGAVTIDVFVDELSTPETPFELAEITFFPDKENPKDSDSRSHTHDVVETFYVLEGSLIHIVNGLRHVVDAGEIAVVHPGDSVIHGNESTDPVRALVFWVPGGEIANLERFGFVETDVNMERSK